MTPRLCLIYAYLYLFLNAAMHEKHMDSAAQNMNPGNDTMESQALDCGVIRGNART